MGRTLIPISKRDVETFRSAVFASKVIKEEKRDKLKEKLEAYYTNNPDSIDAALSYAAFHILPAKTDDPFEQKDSIEEAIKAFKSVKKVADGHWLANFYIIRLQALFADYYGDDQDYINEVDELIKLQESQPDHHPYFVLAYVLMAEMLYNMDEAEKAETFIQKAESFPRQAVAVLNDFLGYLFVEFENKLRMIGENDTAERIKALGHDYFPDMVD